MVIDSSDFELQSLEQFRRLSSNQENHQKLLRDKTAILYAATLTERQDVRVVELCLDVFENFLQNRQAHVVLIGTFGVYEALEALVIRTRKSNAALASRASKITETLRSGAPPAFNTRSRTKSATIAKKQTVHLLHIPLLAPENRQTFEAGLLRIRGVISFLVDVEAKRCTLRLCPKVPIAEAVQKILGRCGLKCLVVRKNSAAERAESFYDVLANGANTSCLEYPEEDFLQKSGALVTRQPETASKGGILNSMRHFWAESFYW